MMATARTAMERGGGGGGGIDRDNSRYLSSLLGNRLLLVHSLTPRDEQYGIVMWGGRIAGEGEEEAGGI